jgi:hypothetical protein
LDACGLQVALPLSSSFLTSSPSCRKQFADKRGGQSILERARNRPMFISPYPVDTVQFLAVGSPALLLTPERRCARM